MHLNRLYCGTLLKRKEAVTLTSCCHQRRICTPWFNVSLIQNASRTRLRETSGDLVIQQWKTGLGKGGEIGLDLRHLLGREWRLTLKVYSEGCWSVQCNRWSVCCMDRKGDGTREGNVTGSSKSIIFFGAGLGKKFHRVSTSQAAINSFLVMAITLQLLWFSAVLSHFSCVQLFVAPWTIDHQAPLSMGIFLARILEWAAMPSSKGSSWPRDQACISCVSCITGRFFTTEPLGKPLIWLMWDQLE